MLCITAPTALTRYSSWNWCSCSRDRTELQEGVQGSHLFTKVEAARVSPVPKNESVTKLLQSVEPCAFWLAALLGSGFRSILKHGFKSTETSVHFLFPVVTV